MWVLGSGLEDGLQITAGLCCDGSEPVLVIGLVGESHRPEGCTEWVWNAARCGLCDVRGDGGWGCKSVIVRA
jgi:hypothetical protein